MRGLFLCKNDKLRIKWNLNYCNYLLIYSVYLISILYLLNVFVNLRRMIFYNRCRCVFNNYFDIFNRCKKFWNRGDRLSYFI